MKCVNILSYQQCIIIICRGLKVDECECGKFNAFTLCLCPKNSSPRCLLISGIFPLPLPLSWSIAAICPLDPLHCLSVCVVWGLTAEKYKVMLIKALLYSTLSVIACDLASGKIRLEHHHFPLYLLFNGTVLTYNDTAAGQDSHHHHQVQSPCHSKACICICTCTSFLPPCVRREQIASELFKEEQLFHCFIWSLIISPLTFEKVPTLSWGWEKSRF